MKEKVQRAKSNHLQEFENSIREKNKKNSKKNLLLVLLLNFELVSDMRFAIVQILIVTMRKPKEVQFSLILALQVIIMGLATIKLLFVRSEEGKSVNLINTVQEVSISLFVLLIVLMENKNDMVEYLMVIALSVSIIAEIIVIMLEVIKDVVEVFVRFIKKKNNKVQYKSEVGQTPFTSVQENKVEPAKRVLKQNPSVNQIVEGDKKKGQKN